MNLGAAKAIVTEVAPADAGTVHVAVRYEDGRIEATDLRADLVPAGLAAGDEVTVTKAALYRRWEITKN